jgi:serine O-acetyltransferase
MLNFKRLATFTYRFIINHGYRGKHLHRITNYLWTHNFKRASMIMMSLNHFLSTVGIGPGAKIHPTAQIVHGNVYIGQTAEIGPYCRISQNVTIGAKLKNLNQNKRSQAILEHHVIVCTGAVILGAVTIGHNSVIGPNSVVTRSIPPYSIVTGNPARVHTRKSLTHVDDWG